MSESSDIAERFLARVPLFRELDQKQLAILAKSVHERSFSPGEAIVHQGEGGIGLFIISSGRAEVSQLRGEKEETLGTLGVADVFGEIALLTDHPRVATVRAVEPTKCLVLTWWNFRALLSENPEMALPLLKEQAERLAEAADWMAKLG